jgi:hypothetical protein
MRSAKARVRAGLTALLMLTIPVVASAAPAHAAALDATCVAGVTLNISLPGGWPVG